MQCDVLIVVYHPRWNELSAALASLSNCAAEFRSLRILVSGSSADFSSLSDILNSLALSQKSVIYHRLDNLGFAGGQNYLLSKAFENGADWALIYNPDLEASTGSLTEFIETCQQRGDRDLYGPWIYNTSPDQGQGTIDSRGIKWTASARHFDISLEPTVSSARFAEVEGLTGACLLVSEWVHEKILEIDGEFFDLAFVAYREDAELGIRALSHGIRSYCVRVPGFFHERGIPSGSRKNSLVNLLSVQNRLLMRWKLGNSRPGVFLVPTLRDLLVVMVCLTIERTSLPGLKGAFQMRRLARYKGWRMQPRI